MEKSTPRLETTLKESIMEKLTPRLETALSAKLKPLRGNIATKNSSGQREFVPLPSPLSWKKDGMDHINIWRMAETPLGQALSQYSPIEFTHPIFGEFSTVEGFWQWIISRENDDRLRNLVGTPLKILSRKLNHRHVPNLRMIVMHACYLKAMQHPEISGLMKEIDLPFDCYYYTKNAPKLRTRPYYAVWMINGYEEIRKAIREGREPSFENMREVGEVGDDMYKPILDILMPEAETETAEGLDLAEEQKAGDYIPPEEQAAS